MNNIIKEYDEFNNLVYIADYYSGKGYRTKKEIKKESSEEKNIEKYIKSLRESRKRQNNKFGILINKSLNFNKNYNDNNIFKILMIFYFVFLIVCIFNFYKQREILHFVFSTQKNYHSSEFGTGMICFLLGVILIHEFSHILISRISNILVLKLGFKLKYYIFPIFYVKAMPTSHRMKKVNIAFVGLVADLLLVNIYFYLYFLYNDSMYFLVALKLQFLLLLFNYNILLPTDFTQALLNYIHKENLRKEMFKEIKNLIFKKQKTKNYLTKKRIILYSTYILLFIVFWLYVFINIIYTLIYNLL